VASAAFERFRFSFFEDTDSVRQGLDKAALAQLEGEERIRTEDMLIRFLPDTRGVIGLGVLRSRRAEPLLAPQFEAERQAQRESELASGSRWFPYVLMHLAKALWQIRPDPRWPTAVIDVLAFADDPMERQSAAEELYDVRGPATVRALMNALDDPYALVRYHAACGLLAIHGLPANSKDPEHMIYKVMSDDTALHEDGKRAILASISARPISEP
jgi:hypothetical protein